MAEFPPRSLRPLIQGVTRQLKEREETISVAETAAGGLVSACLLATPGASAIYRGGLTVYTLESRVAYAGWALEDIQHYSGPTPGVVAGLADHVRGTLQSTYTLCESGTAGPTGGDTRNRTPYVLFNTTLGGYVALAVSTPRGTFTREVQTGIRDRGRNMVIFAEEALRFVYEVVEGGQ